MRRVESAGSRSQAVAAVRLAVVAFNPMLALLLHWYLWAPKESEKKKAHHATERPKWQWRLSDHSDGFSDSVDIDGRSYRQSALLFITPYFT